MPIALSVLGASGKMGKSILDLVQNDPHFFISSGIARNNRSELHQALVKCDVAIDFSSQEALIPHLDAAIRAKKPIVIGTTGHSAEAHRSIETAAEIIPILFSPNFSFGIALCLETVARFARTLHGSCHIDIIETHHVQKKDTPSGTALALAKAAGNAGVLEYMSAKPRNKNEIVIHSIRTGDVFGEHQIIFECGHERIELKHTAYSRDAFAKGALIGAAFLAKRAPGLYSLKDLFQSEQL